MGSKLHLIILCGTEAALASKRMSLKDSLLDPKSSFEKSPTAEII